ncbi:MAG TPA: DNA polymerase III subunit alpha, partial [Porphyromonadaceae bacterium]|nr:DNA polymerase III subunit alpha [Porphyromonadaceae bacterium]
TLEIAEKVEFYEIDHKPIMPNFPIPKEFESADNYLRFLTEEGAKRKYGERLTEEVKERIDFELQTICQMGFPGYFLIVQDFIKASRERGVSVGPGRGSAAGSVVAYCLDITNVDPIQYDLLFERFLNPDRISMPDIDIDFDDEGRGTALQYVIDKYGKEKVAHIITFGTMATKSSIADVARVEKLPLIDSQYLCKLVPAKIPSGKKVTIKEAIKAVPELREAAESEDIKKRNTMQYAQDLEGTVRNTGVHACGIIIAKDELSKFVPMSTVRDKDSGEEMLVTQYEGSVIEEVGMLKMDFLGLKNLSIIRDALKNIQYTTGKEIDIDAIPLTDKKTFRLYQQGKTVGTFQFESAGMQKYLRDLKPTTFEDLIAMNALYRPGPMDYIPSFIARKQGKEPIVYDIPCMEKYLKNTYGITVYQEQVMLLSRQLAGFTRGESDTLRKAMGKKQIDKMNSLKVKFMEGTSKNGYDAKTCEKIWLDWERFASYAFNKSHATCYSLIAYQTAYLKANYPPQYMAALLNSSMKDITEVSKYMEECQKMHIKVFGPDVNESMPDFGVNKKGNIRFGLAAIKGVGEGAAQNIIEEREKNGDYTSIFDFVKRINLTTCNRRVIESLAYSGAFDSFKEIKREQFFAETEKNEQFIDLLIRFGGKIQMDKAENYVSLFGENEMEETSDPSIPKAEAWGETFRLEKEKEMIGFYTSSHPLDKYAVVLKYVCNTPMASLKEKENLAGKTLVLGGVVCDIRSGNTKNGKPYGILKLEDYSGIGEIPLFGKNYLDHRGYFQKGLFLYITAKMEPRKYNEQVLDFSITSIKLLQDIEDSLIHKVTISLPEHKMDIDFFTALETYLEENEGKTPLFLSVYEEDNPTPLTLRVEHKKVKVEKRLLEWIECLDDCSVAIN